MCMDGDIMQVYLANESMDAQSYQVAFYVKNMECEILEKLTGTGHCGCAGVCSDPGGGCFRMGRQEV